MPTAKPGAKKGLIIASKGATKTTRKANTRKKDQDGGDYEQSAPEHETNNSHDIDMEVLQAAYATARAKNTKKKDAEFLKKQKALTESAREQAEGMRLAGETHLKQLMEQFEAMCDEPDNDDIKAVVVPIGQRSTIANGLSHSLALSLEQLSEDFELAIQAASQDFRNRAANRDKIRHQTAKHASRILKKGKEEQQLVADATEVVKRFQQLMKV